MGTLSDWLIAFVSHQNNLAGLGVLALSAAVEYVFPPFPGDTVTLFGAVLITAYAWSFPAVLAAVMIGSVAGSAADYYLGRKLTGHRAAKTSSSRARQSIDRLVDKFERHGAAYLVINRFVPGIRALFFVAAGMAEMRFGPVLFFSAISALLWNLCLIGLGSAVGANFQTLKAWVTRYAAAAWGLLALVALVLAARALWRARRRRREGASD